MHRFEGIINNSKFFSRFAAGCLAAATLVGCAKAPEVVATRAPEPTPAPAVAAVEDEPVIVDDVADPAWHHFVDARLSYLQQLAKPLVACVDASAQPHESAEYPCTTRDWPSLMHAAYGLARIARRTNDPAMAQRAVDALTPEVIAAARRTLVQHGISEDPHAFVWILAAANEHRGRTDLQTLATDVAFALDTWVEELPEDQVMHGVLVGSRDSVAWIVENLWTWAEASGDADLAERMQAFTRGQLSGADLDRFCDPTIDGEPAKDELFSPCLHRVRAVLEILPEEGDKDTWLATLMQERRHLDPVENAPLATHAALNFSRSASLWALYEATGDTAYQQAYVRHIEAQMQSTRWDQHQAADRAWIAQFGVRAIELSFGS